MKKIYFNEKYGLNKAVLEGRKDMTRRIAKELNYPNIAEISDWGIDDKGKAMLVVTYDNGMQNVVYPHYQIGEEVAIAQRYCDIPVEQLIKMRLDGKSDRWPFEVLIRQSKGYKNKMFVVSTLMPNRIKITDMKYERLQGISNDDCMREGISWDYADYPYMEKKVYSFNDYEGFPTPQHAFSVLINRLCGKSTWEFNPFVFAYEFELIR